MKISKIKKVRMMRRYLSVKKNLPWVLWCALCFFVFGVGVHGIYKWTRCQVGYVLHTYIWDDMYDQYNYRYHINDSYAFYENGKHGYILNEETKEKVMKDVKWVSGLSEENDSLLCFASNGKRGYFNVNTGEVAIPADTYVKAWNFSEGLAVVMTEDSLLHIINPNGSIVADTRMRADKDVDEDDEGYIFKNGLCRMSNTDSRWGLIGKDGRWVVAARYDNVRPTEHNFWKLELDERVGLLNDSVRVLLEPKYREVVVADYGIEVLHDDYTRQVLDYDGTVKIAFTYTEVEDMYYKTGVVDYGDDDFEMAVSECKRYQTTNCETAGPYGLLSADGKPLTKPIYSGIEAVNANVYRCYVDDSYYHEEGQGTSILIDKSGRVIN